MINSHQSSFKDPHGSIVVVDGSILRVIKRSYQSEYDHLMNSGLFAELKSEGLIVDHRETSLENIDFFFGEPYYKVIEPTQVFISYPSEWSFTQLKDAAICTLKVQLIALKYNMVLKDCSGYNIQFHQGAPLLIDTLSFRFFKPGEPWHAYRQFCEHFYGPLVLFANVDERLSCLFSQYIDGIPLDLISKLLPWKKKFSIGVILHILLHSRSKTKHKNKNINISDKTFTIDYIRNLTEELINRTENVKWNGITNWSLYYQKDVEDDYLKNKIELIISILKNNGSKRVLDFGANDGTISRHLGKSEIDVISVDYDHVAVDRNYRTIKKNKIKNVIPLVIDAINPTSSFGWAASERQMFSERISVDTVLALALVHHLVIFYNIPFRHISSYLASLSNCCVVEFVPESDPMAQILLQGKDDIYGFYTPENFELAFKNDFATMEKYSIPTSGRTIYYFKK